MASKGKVLIVDDDPRNIFALKETLDSRGYTCLSCLDAKDAVEMASDPSIGIVLMDMMMPGMDGYEAIPAIKNARLNLPVISVTAQAMIGDREKCLSAGADDYISKPIDVDKLLTVIAKFIKTENDQ
ncbi:MAG: response regulator [Bacteroidia bacterium]|nr:response regulator [Bacteroidia bacterium]